MNLVTPVTSSESAGGDARLAGRAALVTGAASGIGRACALTLAAAGARVHALDRDGAAVRALAREIAGEPHEIDLASPLDLGDLPKAVDVLVNNAGFQHVAPLVDFPFERFERMQQVMVAAPFLLIRHTLPHMCRNGWGRIVNISSVHGLRASAGKAGYVTAKHALEGLNKVAAIEAAPHGVTSNCVNPGFVRTPLVERQLDELVAAGADREQALREGLLSRTPSKRLLEPEDVAAAALWLCGPDAASMTGACLNLDGGWTAA